uniref:Uncharacterized protein n=1 Tax=Cucumis melo TaxID=3656 RepID=A0A9I9CKR8_CUCME
MASDPTSCVKEQQRSLGLFCEDLIATSGRRRRLQANGGDARRAEEEEEESMRDWRRAGEKKRKIRCFFL